MKVIQTGIKDLFVLEPQVFGDHRGYFFESFRKDIMDEQGVNLEFIQDNQSMSKKDILRGLHFQKPPYEQGKLVRVLSGAVLDVVVDIRKNSDTYGKSFEIELNEENNKMLWVPPGFAHGFLTLQDDTIFVYKCTQYYNKESEGCIRWDSPKLKIDWGISSPILSEKDKIAEPFGDFESPF